MSSLTADFTEKECLRYSERQKKCGVDNHPMRASGESLFDAMLSNEADLTKHGFISGETLKLLGE